MATRRKKRKTGRPKQKRTAKSPGSPAGKRQVAKYSPQSWVLELLRPGQTNEQRKSSIDVAEQKLVAEVVKLEDLFAGFNSFELLANLALSQLLRDPETYKEHLHHGDASVVEYVALLALKHPYEEGRRGAEPIPLDDIIGNASRIKGDTTFLFGADLISENATESERALADTQFRALSSNMTVRANGYNHHLEADLQALFASSSGYLRAQIGFDLDQALAVERALESLFHSKLSDAHQEMTTQLRQMEEDIISTDSSGWRQFQSSGTNPDLPAGFIKKVRKSKPPKRKALLRSLGLRWFSFRLGRVLSYTATEVARFTSLTEETVKSLLDFFSLKFGSQPPSFFLFETPHQLQRKPFLSHGEKYFYAVPGTLRWALKQGFETILNPDVEPKTSGTKTVWAKYDKRRARYLEDQALSLICGVLPGAKSAQELKYKHLKDGKLAEFELDGLIQYGQTGFLVEAKAGAASPIGGPRVRFKLKNDVRRLIADPHGQGLRAQEYILASANPTFVDGTGTPISLDKASFSRMLLIAVSLDPLDTVHASLHVLVEAGLLEATDSLPWSVSLGSLKVVCDHVEFPSQFIDYVQKRLGALRLFKVFGHDELDWLSDYMNSGLCFEHDPNLKEPDRIMLDTSGASQIDEYYSHAHGERTTESPKLRQMVPGLLKELILEVESRSDWSDRTEAVLALLYWGGGSRESINDAYAEALAQTRADGEIDSRCFADDCQGVTFVTVTNENEFEGRSLLRWHRCDEEGSTENWPLDGFCL